MIGQFWTNQKPNNCTDLNTGLVWYSNDQKIFIQILLQIIMQYYTTYQAVQLFYLR